MIFLSGFKSEVNKIENIYQIKIDVPFQVKFVSLYLFKAGNQHVLFDSGLNMGNWDKKFFAALNQIGVEPSDISYCFISHSHLDHTGLAKKLKRKNPELTVVMHEIANELLKYQTDKNNFAEIDKTAELFAEKIVEFGVDADQGKQIHDFFANWPKFMVYPNPNRLVKDGEIVNIGPNSFRVIWTPGHALGHICLFDESNRYLFAGDHILSRITPHIGMYLILPIILEKYPHHDFHNILKLYLNSLDTIEELNPKIIFPAHQEIIYNPIERIHQIKKHHENRLREISELIKSNPLTPYEISLKHFGNKLDAINQFMALSEILSHIYYLEDLEKVHREEINGKIRFFS